MGDLIVADVHIEADGRTSVEAGHDIAVAVRQRVLARHRVLNGMTHVDQRTPFDSGPPLCSP
ncbi:divalent metal cation (Fe/Co/Zn/Cd) transporter [Paraburkholderia sp. JPY681]|nr:divalent metal cation (Fe/Co/Zn/Cd) transporter [Paraburkholderia atlantica]